MTICLKQKANTLLLVLLLTSGVYIPGTAQSGEITKISTNATDDLKTNIRQFVLNSFPQAASNGNDIQIEISDLDPRFKLSPCDNSLTLTLPQDVTEDTLPGRHSVTVHCDTPSPWTIYLPVSVNVWREIPVLTTALKRGDTLRTQDVVMHRQNLATLYNKHCFQDLAQVIGKTATRNLAADSVLYPELLTESDMVKKGDQVVLMIQAGNITVSSTGKAQQSGKQGDQISVENLTSNRTLTGRIVDKNTVSLSL